MALVEAQPLLRFLFGVSDHLDAPGAGESRSLCGPAVSAQDGFVPPDIGASAEPLEHALDGCSAEDLLDDGEDLGNGQPDPYRDDLPAHRWPAETGGCGCRGGQPTKLVHRHRRSGRVLPPILQKELDIALRQLILVPAGAGGKDSVVAEALGAGEANIDERTPSGQAGDDVAHTDLASFAAEEIAGYEDLLPGGLGGDLQAIDRAGEGDQAEPGFPHVPTEGERAAPLRRHEGHVIGQATEGLRRGLLEQVPVDDVGLSGSPPVVHLATEVHPPQIGVQLGIAVLVSQALLSVDGEPAVVGVHAQGVFLAPRVIVRFDLDDSFPELPAEEHIGPIHGQGLGS